MGHFVDFTSRYAVSCLAIPGVATGMIQYHEGRAGGDHGWMGQVGKRNLSSAYKRAALSFSKYVCPPTRLLCTWMAILTLVILGLEILDI
jgi:hypothetical protein